MGTGALKARKSSKKQSNAASQSSRTDAIKFIPMEKKIGMLWKRCGIFFLGISTNPVDIVGLHVCFAKAGQWRDSCATFLCSVACAYTES